MKKPELKIPDKIFGVDSANVVMFVPLLVVVLLIIVSTNMVFLPKYSDISLMESNLRTLSSEVKQVTDKTRYLQSIDPEELQKNSESLNNALMPQRSAYLLVDVVRKVITKYGFQVDSFLINPGVVDNKTTTPTANKGVSKIPIKIAISGQKAEYLNLIKAIERTLPVLSITDFKMGSLGTMVKLDLEVTAFYLDDNTKTDINRLTLADLTLKKEENDLLTTIGDYVLVSKSDDSSGVKTEYKKFERSNPFSP